MRSHDTKVQLGKRHIEMVVNGKYSDMIVRTITKVKSGDNGFERYYATIDYKRVEVFLNPKGVTGAAFRSEAEYTINLGDENGVVKDNDEKVWWNEEKQDWETIDEAVAHQSNVDLGDDCDGDLEALENELSYPQSTFTDEFIDEVEETFRKRAVDFRLFAYNAMCSLCGRTIEADEFSYIGVADTQIPFEFCHECGSVLKAKKAAKEQEITA